MALQGADRLAYLVTQRSGDREVQVLADLVLDGGGAKDCALAGAVAGLAAEGVEVARVAGTSAGAVVAALLAAGMPAEELDRRMRALDLRELAPPGPLEGLELIGTGSRGLTSLLELGLLDPEPLRTWLRSQLHELGVDTFADLRYDDPDDSLPPEHRYRLVVAATDITRGRQVLLPWAYRDHGLDPDEQLVVDAVRAASAIPFVFEPARLTRPYDDDPILLVDGGLLGNLPVDLFDRTDDRPSRWPTIGIKLTVRGTGSTATPTTVTSTIDYLRALAAATVTGWDQRQLDDPATVARTIRIDTTDVPTLTGDLDREARVRLSHRGRRIARRWMAGRDLMAG